MRHLRWLAIFGSAMLAEHQACAQQADPQQASAQDNSDQLQTVVVTAQRRSEDLQTIPIAATALQGADLSNKAVTELSDLQYAIPSLSIGNTGLTSDVNIRGVGLSSSNAAVTNGVAVYYDGLFQPTIVTSNTFYDLKDVEVLRGPQGTLVGTNSTGGAIFINTQSPVLGQTAGYVTAGGGNYNGWNGQGALNLPFGDVLAVRLAGEFTQHESFYQSAGPVYTNAGSLYEKSGRIGVLFKPGAFQAQLKVEYSDRNTGGFAFTPIPGTQYAPYASTNPFVLNYDVPTLDHEQSLISSLELRYEFANGMTLRSLSGYQDKKLLNLQDQDGASIDTPENPSQLSRVYARDRAWTEEINLLSPTTEHYNWIAGAYLQYDAIANNIYSYGATGPGGPPLFINIPTNKTTTGFFGQLNYKFTPQWELQTGLRYSTYHVDGDGGFVAVDVPSELCGVGGLPPPAPWNGCYAGAISGSEHDDHVTGKVALNYNLDSSNLLYAFVARGYKPGGFNSPTSFFAPETVWDYELGWKASMLDNHIHTQLGAFHYQYQNFQFQELQVSTGQPGVTNLDTAKIDGVEASMQARVSDWGADFGASYLHTHLPSAGTFVNSHLLPASANSLPQCPAGEPSTPPVCFDYTPYQITTDSGPLPFAPEWNLNAGLQYTLRLRDGMSLTPRVNYAYVSGQYTNPTYSKVTDYLPAHGLLSALLTLRLSEQWTIEAFGTNLTDKVYRSGEGPPPNDDNYFYGAPRQYGARATYKF